jgi:LmbE family N-acetylglucosaminyl deacetylase
MARGAAAGHQLGRSLRRILCISAHPDDNEFTIAGSVARWAREGREVAFCLVTTGGAGVNEHTPSSEGLIPIREKETRAAARMLGVKEVVLLGYAAMTTSTIPTTAPSPAPRSTRCSRRRRRA